MSRSAEAWRTDWKAFVDHIASLRAAGRSDQEICEELAGKRVSFEGRIETFMLDDDCAPGLQMRMTPVTASLPRGKVLRTSFVGLNLERRDISSWKRFAIGDRIRFTGAVSLSSGIMPGIWITPRPGSPRRLTMVIGLDRARPVDRVGSFTGGRHPRPSINMRKTRRKADPSRDDPPRSRH
jgi:hypothetical protein